MQRTLVLLKPDALQRALIGEILARFEKRGLKLVGLKMVRLTNELVSEHYAHLTGLPFYPGLKRFMQSAPIVAVCLEGVESVEIVRAMVGATNCREAALGSIRGDLGVSMQSNLVHASDSAENAKREVDRFFGAAELFDYAPVAEAVTYSRDEI